MWSLVGIDFCFAFYFTFFHSFLKSAFSICAPLEEFLKQIEPVKMTNDSKDKFVQQMMLDFDKADLDKDGTINFSGKDLVFNLTSTPA